MIIAITQRVDFIENRNEFRDCVDQSLVKLVLSLGHSPLLVPNSLVNENNTDTLEKYLHEFEPMGILISGGNDIGQYSSRDRTEACIYTWAIENELPILGICRGMQMIGLLNGSRLKKVNGHVKTSHKVRMLSNNNESIKNSYHMFSLTDCPKNFEVIFVSKDGEIEGIKHKNKNIFGIMWHPERESVFANEDLNFIKSVYE